MFPFFGIRAAIRHRRVAQSCRTTLATLPLHHFLMKIGNEVYWTLVQYRLIVSGLRGCAWRRSQIPRSETRNPRTTSIETVGRFETWNWQSPTALHPTEIARRSRSPKSCRRNPRNLKPSYLVTLNSCDLRAPCNCRPPSNKKPDRRAVGRNP